MGTLFTNVYDRFFSKITDDLYLELTPRDTVKDLRNLLVTVIPGFEFPRQVLSYKLSHELIPYEGNIVNLDSNNVQTNPNYLNSALMDGVLNLDDIDEETLKNNGVLETSSFDNDLTDEEIEILALLMMIAWTQRQVTSIENTRMKYTGADFKMSSQANHLSKLLALLAECQRQSHHFQRLYKRRYHDDSGKIHSNWRIFGRDFNGIRF